LSGCVFCSIIAREIPAEIVWEDAKVVAFRDIDPQAPKHFLLVPKVHLSTILELEEKEKELIGHIFIVANKIAEEEGLASKGFRIVMNCKEDGGQAVFHLHFHLLGGRKMGWPPG
jgi:histidine triad (HIT) family protein